MSDPNVLKELNRLGRILMKPVEPRFTIGGFNLKEQRLIRRHLDGDEEWLFTMRDSALAIYKETDTPRKLLVEFNGFGEVAFVGPHYDVVDACGVLMSLRKLLILDALADV